MKNMQKFLYAIFVTETFIILTSKIHSFIYFSYSSELPMCRMSKEIVMTENRRKKNEKYLCWIITSRKEKYISYHLFYSI